MQITVEVRSIYGRDTVYPACADARRFADIAGSKTLTSQTLRLIRDLGYTIRVQHPAITEA